MGRRSRSGTVWFATSALALGLFSFGSIPNASAGIKIGEKFTLSSDFRFRYEIDDERRTGTTSNQRTRDRWRIRFRLGFTYDHSDRVQFGMRLRTEADSAQSPHETLGENSFSTDSGKSQDFGLDRAYIKFKWLESGFAWLGKNQAAIWQQNEQFWDADFQAEGATAGYALPLGDKNKVTLQGSYYLIAEDSFGGGGGVFNDRAILPIQVVYNRNLGPAGLTLAGLVAPTTAPDNTANTAFPGGRRTYYMYSAQAKLQGLPVPVTVGYEGYYGNSSRAGHGAALRVKPLKEWPLELRGYYYYVPLNSVPLQGAIVQDDFRFSSNFKGFQLVANYKFAPNLNIQFRAMPQDTIDENVTGVDTNIVQTSGYNTRYQMNLNIKF
ncbi:putative porin [Nitrospiraceae bacterium AH_259_D15_M11_P09]|nr:putative porin [Nitrospiraceae bacterium AH_259_D15_M11_P09]